jgi:hypothetical protein
MTSPSAQNTDFSRDILARYTCNGLDEALLTTDTSVRPDAKLFDVIVIGGGSFAGVLAQHLFSTDAAHRHRILVLEAGRLALAEHVQNLPALRIESAWSHYSRSGCRSGGDLGSSLAHKCGRRISRPGVLHRRQVYLLRRLVASISCIGIARSPVAGCHDRRHNRRGRLLRSSRRSDWYEQDE